MKNIRKIRHIYLHVEPKLSAQAKCCLHMPFHMLFHMPFRLLPSPQNTERENAT